MINDPGRQRYPPLANQVTMNKRMKVKMARVLCHPVIGRALAAVFRDRIGCRGCSIDTKGNIAPSIKASLFWGFYESAEIRFVKRFLPPDQDVIELGSSLGVLSSHVGRRLLPGKRMVCVEANRGLLGAIRSNVTRNAPWVEVTVIHGAIDYSPDNRSAVPFAVGKQNIDSRIAEGLSSEGISLVPAVRLSSLIDRVRDREVTLVCDIEGAEVGMIKYDPQALQRCRTLIIELHATTLLGRSISTDELYSDLLGQGFVLRARYGPVCVFERESGQV